MIALAGQSVGPLYCYGTEDGIAVLCEVGSGPVCELERTASYMSNEQAAWSEDGGRVAISDLSGKLSIKRISKTEQNQKKWQVSREFALVISPQKGHINQLIFHPSGTHALASTFTTLYSVYLDTHTLVESTFSSRISEVK